MRSLTKIYSHFHRDLTNSEMIIGGFSILMMGIGIVCIILSGWNIAETVLPILIEQFYNLF
jgi:hypothetical protein